MNTVRSLFVSDIHLGTRACQAERLVAFLRAYHAEHLYLVGDIVDFWAMNRSIHWSEAQNTVVQKVLRRARAGEHVMLIPGNHDEALRDYLGTEFGNIRIEGEWVHVTADGRRLLLVHGDAYDQVTRHHRWVALLGDVAYNLLVRLNVTLSWLRRQLGRPGYWSLAGYAKRRVKRALEFIYDYEASVIHAVRERGLDGVICGHIHCAAIKEVAGLTYINCGDWVDSCTAIVEHLDGRLELVDWGAGAVADHAGAAARPRGATSSGSDACGDAPAIAERPRAALRAPAAGFVRTQPPSPDRLRAALEAAAAADAGGAGGSR
ncbi:MAG TPA: UDP-2,3-diacylglucosamine diphosphatase [Rhodocyclaceae bacterium]|nr:UDP-2,3-diacylglucosamine diphosphatase [Rhodocyclaceae bacterium]